MTAEERALEAYPIVMSQYSDNCKEYDSNESDRLTFIEGYRQAENDLIDKTLDFLKDKLYENGYVGIIDLCDDYIKAMKDE